jgi:hypothetical protein
MGCAASGNWVVLTEHIDPAHDEVPPDGVLDDPYRVVAQSLQGETHVLHEGYLGIGTPLNSGTYAVWPQGDGRPHVVTLDGSQELALAQGDYGFQLAVDDQGELVFSVVEKGGQTISVGTIDGADG